MADNYLEKKYDEAFGTRKVTKHVGHTLDELLTKNRSTRGYDPQLRVGRERLEKIAAVNCKTPSARNQQVLRFRLVHTPEECAQVLQCVKMGAALPELHLPLPGTEPTGYIAVCAEKEPDPMVYIDLGISVQSMLLRAVEMGLNGLCICAVDRPRLQQALRLPSPPLAVVAVGRSAEHHRLKTITARDPRNYYREEDGTHVVPKLRLEDLLLPEQPE